MIRMLAAATFTVACHDLFRSSGRSGLRSCHNGNKIERKIITKVSDVTTASLASHEALQSARSARIGMPGRTG